MSQDYDDLIFDEKERKKLQSYNINNEIDINAVVKPR